MIAYEKRRKERMIVRVVGTGYDERWFLSPRKVDSMQLDSTVIPCVFPKVDEVYT